MHSLSQRPSVVNPDFLTHPRAGRRTRQRGIDALAKCAITAASVLLLCAGAAAGFPPPRPIPPATLTSVRFAVADPSGGMEMPLDSRRPVRVLHVLAGTTSDAGDVSARERVASAVSDRPEVLRVLSPVRVLEGQSVGTLLVAPVAAGEANLTVAGARLHVRITPADASVAGWPTDAPELLAPAPGSGVFGTIAVGVGAWSSDTALSPGLIITQGSTREVRTAKWTTSTGGDRPNQPGPGPYRLASVELSTDSLDEGPCTLTPALVSASGEPVRVGRSVDVHVLHPASEAVATIECEQDFGLLVGDQVGPPKPIASRTDPLASGGRFFDNAAADPKCRLRLVVPEASGGVWYQFIVRAAGDPALGALPSVGLTIDEAQRPATVTPIAQNTWHRVPLGLPVRLEPGPHVLRLDFLNDFAARNTDRNLRLDALEVIRLTGPATGVSNTASVASAGDESASNMSAMTSMSAMAGTEAMTSTPSASSMSAMSSMSSGQPADAANTGAGGWPITASSVLRPALQVAFERPIDGQLAQGEVEIRGLVRLQDAKNAPSARTPTVTLLVDDRPVATQRAEAPRFILPTDTLAPGPHRVQLVARDHAGRTDRTTVQHLIVPATAAEHSLAAKSTTEAPRASERLTVHEPVWFPTLGDRMKEGQGSDERLVAQLDAGTRVSLELSESLEGEFDVRVEYRRASGRGARLDVALDTGALPPEPLPIFAAARTPGVDAPDYWEAHDLTPTSSAPLRLNAGPKRLVLSVLQRDGAWPKPGSASAPGIQLQAVRLVQRPSVATPALVNLDFPPDGEPVAGASAIVARVWSPAAIVSAEVIIDDKPTGVVHDLWRFTRGTGRILVPLLARDVPPGPHRVRVRFTDRLGQVALSPERTVRVIALSEESPRLATTYDRAVLLLDRLAFGPDQRELADLLALGPEAWLTSRLHRGADDSTLAARELATARLTNPRSAYDVPRRALLETATTLNPVRARFVLFMQNHFSTWIRKVDAHRRWDEHVRFADAGPARFFDLLSLSATSPAMLRYLDQERSTGGRLNENYAREIMELHTLGVHAGYSQRDVTSLAQVLTGWTTTRQAVAGLALASAAGPLTPDEDGLAESVRFEPALADTLAGSRTVFGLRIGELSPIERHQRVQLALEHLSSHPACARFVCTKLARHYLGPTNDAVPEGLLAAMVDCFLRTDGDMPKVMLTMALHERFLPAAAARPRVAHPLDFALRLLRTSGSVNVYDAGDYLGSSGFGLFERPTPDGYPEDDRDGMDSNALLQRWRLASKIDSSLADAVPGSMRWTDRPISDSEARTLIDLVALRLTGRVLSPASVDASLRVLGATEPELPPRPQDLQRDSRLRTLAAFIAQLPECSLR